MKKQLKPIPQFTSEAEEREFWANHSSVEYIDWGRAKKVVFPHLKPSTQTISLRLPQALLDRIRTEAHRRDVPYQTYMKIKLDELFGHPATR